MTDQALPRARSAVAVGFTVLLTVLVSCVLAEPAAAAAPTVTVHGKRDAAGRYLTGTSMAVAGGWSDAAGVAQVRVSVWDRERELYRTAAGTWQARPVYALATLVPTSATATGYTLSLTGLPAGTFRVSAKGVNRAGVLGAPAGVTITVAPGVDLSGRYLSVLFGRSTWAPADACLPVPGAKTLEDAVAALAEAGRTAVGGVVLDRTQATSRFCDGQRILYPSWADLARLRDEYGAVFVSQSKTYRNWLTLTTEEQFRAETCDTIGVLEAHGHSRSWGMFNFPDNKITPNGNTIPAAQVRDCFAFGRRYNTPTTLNSLAALTREPFLVQTLSVTSGPCNVATLPCWSVPSTSPTRYMTPDLLAHVLAPASGQYAAVQFYRFVTGAKLTGSLTWDCRDADPRRHWSSAGEVYCWEDYLAALELIPDGVTVTDPASVAAVIGRLPEGRP